MELQVSVAVAVQVMEVQVSILLAVADQGMELQVSILLAVADKGMELQASFLFVDHGCPVLCGRYHFDEQSFDYIFISDLIYVAEFYLSF